MSDQHFYVDLGYGQYGHTPITTLESVKRFRRYNIQLSIFGIQIDKKLVREAQQFANSITYFRQGGFNLPLQIDSSTGQRETVNLMCASNVLRQYDFESDCRDSHIIMCNHLNINGTLIEGTSNSFGRIWVTNTKRKQIDQSLLIEALVFSTNFRDGYNIASFPQVLPKNFIHRMTGRNKMIYHFF